MNRLGTIAIGLAGGMAVLTGIGWAGFQVRPVALPAPTDDPQDLGVVDLPADLPAPVQRYFQAALGNKAPRIDSLVAVGRARAKFGLWMPLRYRLVHRPGYEFERYMEVTWFGLPVLKAIDRFVDGKGMAGPVGRAATGPAVDQAANMILWAEAPLMPSIWISDPRLRWEAIDDSATRLFFPFDDGEDEITIHFDPDSHLITRISALRFRDEQSAKVPWHVDFLAWRTDDKIQVPSRIAVTWQDQGAPWSYWEFDDLRWNVDISQTLP